MWPGNNNWNNNRGIWHPLENQTFPLGMRGHCPNYQNVPRRMNHPNFSSQYAHFPNANFPQHSYQGWSSGHSQPRHWQGRLHQPTYYQGQPLRQTRHFSPRRPRHIVTLTDCHSINNDVNTRNYVDRYQKRNSPKDSVVIDLTQETSDTVKTNDTQRAGFPEQDVQGGSGNVKTNDTQRLGMVEQDEHGGSGNVRTNDTQRFGIAEQDVQGGSGNVRINDAQRIGIAEQDVQGVSGNVRTNDTHNIGIAEQDLHGGSGDVRSNDTQRIGIAEQDVQGGSGDVRTNDTQKIGIAEQDVQGGSGDVRTNDTQKIGIAEQDVQGGSGNIRIIVTQRIEITEQDVQGGSGDVRTNDTQRVGYPEQDVQGGSGHSQPRHSQGRLHQPTYYQEQPLRQTRHVSPRRPRHIVTLTDCHNINNEANTSNYMDSYKKKNSPKDSVVIDLTQETSDTVKANDTQRAGFPEQDVQGGSGNVRTNDTQRAGFPEQDVQGGSGNVRTNDTQRAGFPEHDVQGGSGNVRTNDTQRVGFPEHDVQGGSGNVRTNDTQRQGMVEQDDHGGSGNVRTNDTQRVGLPEKDVQGDSGNVKTIINDTQRMGKAGQDIQEGSEHVRINATQREGITEKDVQGDSENVKTNCNETEGRVEENVKGDSGYFKMNDFQREEGVEEDLEAVSGDARSSNVLREGCIEKVQGDSRYVRPNDTRREVMVEEDVQGGSEDVRNNRIQRDGSHEEGVKGGSEDVRNNGTQREDRVEEGVKDGRRFVRTNDTQREGMVEEGVQEGSGDVRTNDTQREGMVEEGVQEGSEDVRTYDTQREGRIKEGVHIGTGDLRTGDRERGGKVDEGVERCSGDVRTNDTQRERKVEEGVHEGSGDLRMDDHHRVGTVKEDVNTGNGIPAIAKEDGNILIAEGLISKLGDVEKQHPKDPGKMGFPDILKEDIVDKAPLSNVENVIEVKEILKDFETGHDEREEKGTVIGGEIGEIEKEAYSENVEIEEMVRSNVNTTTSTCQDVDLPDIIGDKYKDGNRQKSIENSEIDDTVCFLVNNMETLDVNEAIDPADILIENNIDNHKQSNSGNGDHKTHGDEVLSGDVDTSDIDNNNGTDDLGAIRTDEIISSENQNDNKKINEVTICSNQSANGCNSTVYNEIDIDNNIRSVYLGASERLGDANTCNQSEDLESVLKDLPPTLKENILARTTVVDQHQLLQLKVLSKIHSPQVRQHKSHGKQKYSQENVEPLPDKFQSSSANEEISADTMSVCLEDNESEGGAHKGYQSEELESVLKDIPLTLKENILARTAVVDQHQLLQLKVLSKIHSPQVRQQKSHGKQKYSQETVEGLSKKLQSTVLVEERNKRSTDASYECTRENVARQDDGVELVVALNYSERDGQNVPNETEELLSVEPVSELGQSPSENISQIQDEGEASDNMTSDVGVTEDILGAVSEEPVHLSDDVVDSVTDLNDEHSQSQLTNMVFELPKTVNTLSHSESRETGDKVDTDSSLGDKDKGMGANEADIDTFRINSESSSCLTEDEVGDSRADHLRKKNIGKENVNAIGQNASCYNSSYNGDLQAVEGCFKKTLSERFASITSHNSDERVSSDGEDDMEVDKDENDSSSSSIRLTLSEKFSRINQSRQCNGSADGDTDGAGVLTKNPHDLAVGNTDDSPSGFTMEDTNEHNGAGELASETTNELVKPSNLGVENTNKLKGPSDESRAASDSDRAYFLDNDSEEEDDDDDDDDDDDMLLAAPTLKVPSSPTVLSTPIAETKSSQPKIYEKLVPGGTSRSIQKSLPRVTTSRGMTLDNLLTEHESAVEHERVISEINKELQHDLRQGGFVKILDREEEVTIDSIPADQQQLLDQFNSDIDRLKDQRPGELVFEPQLYQCLFGPDLHPTHCGFTAESGRGIEQHILSLSPDQYSSLVSSDLLCLCFNKISSKAPLLRWLFLSLSCHDDPCMLRDCERCLLELTSNRHFTWLPDIADILSMFVNCGATLETLGLDRELFSTDDVRSHLFRQPGYAPGDVTTGYRPEHLAQMVKVLSRLLMYSSGKMSGKDLTLLLTLLGKISLDEKLKNLCVKDVIEDCFGSALQQYTEDDWSQWRLRLTRAVATLSSHHHNQTSIIQLFPCTQRGQYVQRRSSFIVLNCLLLNITDISDSQLEHLQVEDLYELVTEMKQLLDSDPYLLSSIVTLLDLCVAVNYNWNDSDREQLKHLLNKVRQLRVRDNVSFLDRTRVKDMLTRMTSSWAVDIQIYKGKQMKIFEYGTLDTPVKMKIETVKVDQSMTEELSDSQSDDEEECVVPFKVQKLSYVDDEDI